MLPWRQKDEQVYAAVLFACVNIKAQPAADYSLRARVSPGSIISIKVTLCGSGAAIQPADPVRLLFLPACVDWLESCILPATVSAHVQ